MSNQLVTINLVVWNGEKYLRHCLDSIRKQTHDNIQVNIWDNASTDRTREIINREYKEFKLIESKINIGMWPAQEELLKYSDGDYVVVISVDIILDENFIAESITEMEKDYKVGALQAKIYQYSLETSDKRQATSSERNSLSPVSRIPGFAGIIDTCGFKIFRSRELNNIGHGVESNSILEDGKKLDFDFNKVQEIFAVEGAVPVFRKKALEDCRIQGHFVDPDFFWYGDDIDLTWRMRMFGWKQIYSPRVIAYHDRGTTKNLANSKLGFIGLRRQLPMFKRRLDWRNWTLTVIKNDFPGNFIRDLPYIFWRQFQMWGYFLIFEPAMFLELPKVVRLLPRMLKRRRVIMKKAKVSAREIRIWFE